MTKKQKVLFIFFMATLGFTGTIMLIAALISQNPIKFEEPVIEEEQRVLGINPPLQIPNLNQSVPVTKLEWGKNIKSGYSTATDKNVIITQKNSENIVIQRINSLYLPENLYELPLDSQNIKVYNDLSVSYIIQNAPFTEQKLILKEGENQTEFELSFENEFILDYFFEPEENLFYLLTLTKNDFLKVYILLNNRESEEIYRTKTNSRNAKIINVSKTLNSVNLKIQNTCIVINLSKKEHNEDKCFYIKHTDLDFNLLINSDELLYINTADGQIKKLIKINELYSYDNFTVNGSNLYYLRGDAYLSSQKNIYYIDLNNLKNKKLNVDLPQASIKRIFFVDNNVCLILNSDIEPIICNVESNEFTNDSNDIAYTDSIYEGWKKLSLNTGFSELELINQTPIVYSNSAF